ncbi:YopX family protein [Paenibacillus alkalitolerans]|uniref:YopX family protein n=1 Tax=Paenibacillus alkalitolerans TaxID=2799335 RepID=UPI0018F69BEF|nr:YopX family protein [Paenibacillus alkalitolerans]
MRELKFRTWDKRTHQMFPNEMLLLSGRELVKFAKRMRPNIPDMQNAKGGLLLPTDDENMVFMQYTGLKDKNGKEIYESDRFKHGKSIGTIVYEGDSFNIKWDDPNTEWWNDILKNHAPDGEVIGNVWEHPHLLEEGEKVNG